MGRQKLVSRGIRFRIWGDKINRPSSWIFAEILGEQMNEGQNLVSGGTRFGIRGTRLTGLHVGQLQKSSLELRWRRRSFEFEPINILLLHSAQQLRDILYCMAWLDLTWLGWPEISSNRSSRAASKHSILKYCCLSAKQLTIKPSFTSFKP